MNTPLENIPPENLIMGALFQDAISGEFRPHTDTKKRSHTLARLGIATATKGRIANSHYSENAVLIEYQPSWAPIHSLVVCEWILTEDADDLYRLTDIDLVADGTEETGLSVVNRKPFTWRDGGLSVDGPLGKLNQDLALDDELSSARAFVTQSAQIFFDSLTIGA